MKQKKLRSKKKIRVLALVLLLGMLSGCQLFASESNETGSLSTTSDEATPDTADEEVVLAPELEATVLEQGIVSRLAEGELKYQAWPTVCMDENGVLYTANSLRYGHFDPFGKNVLYKSTDNGKTWSEGAVINESPLDDRDTGLLYLGNGKMLMTYFCHPASYYLEDEIRWQSRMPEESVREMLTYLNGLTAEQRKGGSYVRISNDYGATWGDPIKVPVSSPHGPTVLQNGDLLYVGTRSYWEASDDPNGTEYSYGFYAFISKDGGYTWNYHSRIKFFKGYTDTDFYEPYAIQLANGRILVALRASGEKFPNHLSVYLTYSDNGGKNWSEAKILCEDFTGAPAHLIQLDNGAVVITYGRRVNEAGNPCGIRARYSRDNGATWSEEIVLSNPLNPEDTDLGYPATVILKDGSLFTVYYQHYNEDTYPSVLYTKWTLTPTES